MTIDFSKKVQLVTAYNGEKEVTIISTNGRGQYPIIGYIGEGTCLEKWDRAGKHFKNGNFLCLENVPEEYFLYLNIYPIDLELHSRYTLSETFSSREKADKKAGVQRIGCLKIKLEARFDD